MAQVYNHQTKQWEDRDDVEASELVRSGSHTFAKGLEIPVVFPDGGIGTIQSEYAQEAFNDGFRMQTKADRDVFFNKQQDEIKREHFDKPGLAFGLGVARGATLGATDVGLRALGVGEEAKMVKEMSPKASAAGAVTGAIGATLAAPVAGLGIVGRGAQAVTGATEAALAARGVGTLGKAIATGAVEGAYWGAGEGVSEAALGNPDEIVGNLISNMGFGALAGGAFGAALTGAKATAPYLQTLTNKALSLGERATKGLAKEVVERVSVPALNLAGKHEAARIFPELVDDPELLSLLAKGKYAEARTLYRETMATQKVLKREQKDLASQIKHAIKNATDDEAAAIKSLLQSADNDVHAALRDSASRLKEMGTQFDDMRATMTGPTLFGEPLVKDMEKQALKLKAFGGEAKAVANEIIEKTKAYSKLNPTEGGEVQMIRDIKALVGPMQRKKIQGDAHDIAKSLWSDTDNLLKHHPNEAVAQHFQTFDPLYRAHSELSKIYNKAPKKGGGIHKFLYDPVTAEQVTPFLTSLKEFSPELATIKAAGTNIQVRERAMKELAEKYRQLNGQSINPDTMPVFKELIDELVKSPVIGKKMQRVEEIQSLMADLPNLSPMDGMARIYQALGRDIKELEPYAKFYKNWEKIQILESASKGDKLSAPMRGVFGYSVGGPVGATVAMGAEAASNPLKVLTFLGKINENVRRGSDLLNKALAKTGKALVSPLARTTATVTTAQKESMERKRERFQQVKTVLGDLSSPERMAAQIETMAGNAPGLSNFKLAMATRMQTSLSYLKTQLPQDQLAGRTLTGKSPWKPSDLEVAAFMRKVDIVNNPLSVIETMESGIVTGDQIAALQAVHPDIYSRLQNAIMSAIMEHGDQIPYSRRIMLGNMFNIPTDPALDPSFVNVMQSSFAPQDLGGRPEGSRTKNIEISPFDTVQTETSRLTYGTA